VECLLRLVNDLETLDASWERVPVVSSALADFSDVFSVGTAERLIHSGLPLPAVRLFRQGELLSPDLLARRRDVNARSRERMVDGGKVARYVSEGATLVLEELQSYCPEVARFAAEVTQATGWETDCTAFLTPRNARGVAPHYDLASVFLRQVAGAKRWRVGAPVQRWPSGKRDPSAPPLAVEPVLDVVLKEGECLYIPRGFVHVGDTADEASVHLSLSVRPVTWAAVLTRLLGSAADEIEELREALPPDFSAADREELFRGRLAVLVDRLGTLSWSDVDLDAFRTRNPPLPAGPSLLDLLEGR
jgi:ribosomal protein L16 Arg81 hydroxylase